jgi:hypothetical protein
VRSLKIFEPDIGVYIHGINLHKKSINQLRNNYSNIIDVTNTKIKYVPEDSWRPHGKGHGWFAKVISLRAGSIIKAMKKFPHEEYFVLIDTDMCVVNPLDDVKQLIEDNDIVMIPLETKQFSLKISAGFLIFSRTPNSIKFLNTFNKYSLIKPYRKQHDQTALVNAYREHEGYLKYGIVGNEYIDHLQRNDTYIWSAHKSISGKKKHKMKLFSHFVQGIETRPNEINEVRKEISKSAKLYRKKIIPKYLRERMGE